MSGPPSEPPPPSEVEVLRGEVRALRETNTRLRRVAESREEPHRAELASRDRLIAESRRLVDEATRLGEEAARLGEEGGSAGG